MINPQQTAAFLNVVKNGSVVSMARLWNHLHLKWVRLLQVACPLVLGALGLAFPRHVAFIMDGNRRYARRANQHTAYGHRKGFACLLQTIKWCTYVGVREVTVYAFSIENFKRSQEEVSFLMDLATEKFQALLNNMSELDTWGVRVRVVGRMELLPAHVRAMVARVCVATSGNRTILVNLAAPYTGRDEISRTASAIVTGVRGGELPAEAVETALVSRALELRAPQLLVRTSGEVRLSDFMLWQVSDTVLYFTHVLWPDFDFKHFLAAVVHYWRHAPEQKSEDAEPSDAAKTFLDNLEKARWREMEILASS